MKNTFSKSIIFKVKHTFEPNVLKWVIKIISSIQVPLAFKLSMLKSSLIFERNGAHLVEKKDVWKK
jgi:hypothetical protein